MFDGGLGQAELVGLDIGKGRFAGGFRDCCVELAAGDFGGGDGEVFETAGETLVGA